MNDDAIDYQDLLHQALRGVVREALRLGATTGLPGDHYFLLTFHTDHPEVRMPRHFHDLHPREMSIVLQHQFWDLEVSEEAFSVTLSFGGRRQRLTIPFASLVTFADPAAEFGLQFESAGSERTETKPESLGPRPVESPPASGPLSRPTGGLLPFDPERKR